LAAGFELVAGVRGGSGRVENQRAFVVEADFRGDLEGEDEVFRFRDGEAELTVGNRTAF
jgi:hypothetical protein